MEPRQHILFEATRLMAARGYEGTSLKAIADAVGVTKATLLYHVSSKGQLRQAVLDQLLSHWNELLPRLLRASTLTGEERFDALLDALIAFFLDDPDRARLLLREMLDRPAVMDGYLRERVRPWIEVIAKTIRSGQPELVCADVDPDAYVILVIQIVLASVANARALRPLFEGASEAEDAPRTEPETHTDEADARARLTTEIKRMARAALFLPQGSP